jgi:hypothetical protein
VNFVGGTMSDEARKIAICGAYGAGKTTLAKRISEKANLFLIPEFAREMIIDTGFEWKKSENVDHIYNFEMAILYNHLFYISQLKSYVCDTTIWDIYAYCVWHWKRIGSWAGRLEGLIKIVEKAWYWCNYEQVFLYKEGYQEKDDAGLFIEETIEERLQRYNVPYVCINKGDILIIKGRIIEVKFNYES